MTDKQRFEEECNKLAAFIHSHQRFLISSHIRPDGDAIGASLSLKRLLEKVGKDGVWMMEETVDSMFDRFYEASELTVYHPETNAFTDRDALVMVDAGEWSRLGKVGEAMQTWPADKLCIDHHIPQNDFPGLRIVDTQSPSTTVLMHRIIRHLHVPLDRALAEPIYLGLIVDTQNFHLPNTTVEAHHIAAECLQAGVKPDWVHEPVYGTTSLSKIRFLSKAMQTLDIQCSGKIALMYTTQAMREEAQAKPMDDDGFVDFVRSIENVRIGVYIREENGQTVKVSWRSKGDNDILASALHFGGGGHRCAAGATVAGTLEEVKQRVWENLRERVQRGDIQ